MAPPSPQISSDAHCHTIQQARGRGTGGIQHTQSDWSNMETLCSEFEYQRNDTSFSQPCFPPARQFITNAPPSSFYPGVNPTSLNQMVNNHISMNEMGGNMNNSHGHAIGLFPLALTYHQPQGFVPESQDQVRDFLIPYTSDFNYSNSGFGGQGNIWHNHFQTEAQLFAIPASPHHQISRGNAMFNQSFSVADPGFLNDANDARNNENTHSQGSQQDFGVEPRSFGPFEVTDTGYDLFEMPQDRNTAFCDRADGETDCPKFSKNSKSLNEPPKKTRRGRARLRTDPFDPQDNRQGPEMNDQGTNLEQSQQRLHHEGSARENNQSRRRDCRVSSGHNDTITIADLLATPFPNLMVPTDEDIEVMNAMSDEDLRFARQDGSGLGEP